MRRRVEVTIEELALFDLPGVDGPRVARALASELTRLLSEKGRAIAEGDGRPARATELRLARGETPESIGGRLAQAVQQRLTS